MNHLPYWCAPWFVYHRCFLMNCISEISIHNSRCKKPLIVALLLQDNVTGEYLVINHTGFVSLVILAFPSYWGLSLLSWPCDTVSKFQTLWIFMFFEQLSCLRFVWKVSTFLWNFHSTGGIILFYLYFICWHWDPKLQRVLMDDSSLYLWGLEPVTPFSMRKTWCL